MTLRISLAQSNLLVGDVVGNATRVIEAACRARDEQQADVVVFPELTLTSYPPEDLLLRPELVRRVERELARIESIDENLGRLGLSATVLAADASNTSEWWDGELFDGILLDAPCSATGVIRRHPDIKLLRRASDIKELCELQATLLDALWRLLAPGGYLLYATCSTLAAENNEVVGRFLEDHDDAVEDDVLPNNNIRDLMRRKARGFQVLPGTAGLDGFYYACLEKKVS